MRPPAVQILPSRPVAPQPGTLPVPAAIAVPSRNVAGPPPSAPAGPFQAPTPSIASTSENHPQAHPSFAPEPPAQTTDFTSATISDAQIDPALLEAVVTALRHADENRIAPPDEAAVGGQGLALNGDRAVKVPTQRRRSSRPQVEGSDENNAEASKRTRRGRSYMGEGETLSQPARRRRSTTASADVVEGEEREDQPYRKRSRRSRAPSLPPYNPDADPGEEIDPTAVTMAELCEDTGRGRVSSKAAQIMDNHAAWRQANREKRVRQRTIAEAKKYGRNLEEEENASGAADPSNENTGANGGETDLPSTAESSAAGPSVEVVDGETERQKGDDFDYTQAMSTSRYNVQVRIGPNGETIIDETSLFVDRQEEDETANYTHIEESDTTKFVNSSTYSKKLRGSRWSAEETELFYDVRALLAHK